MTIKQRFEKFTTNIRPTNDHISEANRQTKFMVDSLTNKVSADETFTLEKILKAGSNAKFTSLMKTDDNSFDVDLGAYYSGEGATKGELDTLLQFTHDKLVEIYPQKNKKDFTILKSAVNVSFKSGIKLSVDVAPIIKDDTLGITNAGWIPRPDAWRLTSVTAHNNFVKNRTSESSQISGPVKFNRLVRMIKWWNNRQGDLAQPSIFCELLAAAAIEDCGVTGEWQTSLRNVFSFIRKHQFDDAIMFGDNYEKSSVKVPTDEVVVLDSVNQSNNVTSTWTKDTKEKFIARAQDAYDHMIDALSAEKDGDEDEAVDYWCEVFGPKFRTLTE